MRVTTYETTVSSGSIDLVDNMQLMGSKGTNSLPYTPYTRHIFPIPEAVQNLEGYGQGVPNTPYYNKIVLDPLNGKKYKKNAVKYELSALTWSKNASETAWHFRGDKKLINKFLTNYSGDYPIYFDASINGLVLGTGIGVFDSVEQVESYLQDVFAIIALETSEITDVSHLFTDDNLLPVEAYGDITAVNEFEQAVPFTIEYTVKGA